MLPNPPRQLLGRHDHRFVVEWIQGDPQPLRRFFFGSPTSSPPEPGDVGAGRSSRSSSLTRGSSAFALTASLSRRIPTLKRSRHVGDANSIVATSTLALSTPKKQRRVTLAGIGLTHYPQLVLLASKASTLRLLAHFRILSTPAASRPAGSPVTLRAPPIPPRSLSLPTYSCVDPPPPSTLISRGEVSQRCWHRGEVSRVQCGGP